MTSYRITLSPSRRAAARFVAVVRRELLKALTQEHEESGLTQTDVAKTIGVHRSVINRELRGYGNITLGRVAELANAMGRKPVFQLIEIEQPIGANISVPRPTSQTKARVQYQGIAEDTLTESTSGQLKLEPV